MNEILQNLLVATLLAILPIITQTITKYLKGLSNDKYIRHATDIVIAVVCATSQTIVDDLKRDGEFTREAQKMVFLDAKAQILNMLNEKSKIVLKELYGDLDAWIETQIESVVKGLK